MEDWKMIGLAILLGVGLIAFKEIYIIGALDYPASPAEVDTEKEMHQYCSYSTDCEYIYPEYRTGRLYTIGIVAAFAAVFAVARYSWRST